MGRQPRLHRAAHLALARPGDREAGLPADRPRSERRRSVAVRAPDRSRCSRGHGRAGACVVPQDLRCDGDAHHGADQARARLPGGAALRESAGRGGRAANRRPGGRDDDVAGQGPAGRLRRLRPELARQDDRDRLLGAADPGRARLGAAACGTRCPLSTRPRSRSRRCRSESRRSATRRPACGATRRACRRGSSAWA